MKQLLFLAVMTALGAVGAMYHPFWALLLYYTLAVLRPQHLWEWALPLELRWSLVAAGLVFVGLLANLRKIPKPSAVSPVVILMLAYAILLGISCLTAFDVEVAHVWALQYAKIFIIAVAALALLDSIWQLRLLALMIALVVGYEAYEINFTYFIDHRLDILHRGFGGLDNNGAGLMLAMGLPFAYAAATRAPRVWQRLACWGLCILIMHAVMMSYSRGAMLSAVVGATWVLWHHRPRLQTAAIVLILCAAISVLAGKEIRDRFMTTTSFSQDHSAQLRFESWAAGWRMAWDHPLTGYGIRNSNQFIINYGADRAGRTIHSQYLQLAADSGIPALGAYVLLLGAVMWNLNRGRRRVEWALVDVPPPCERDLLDLRQVLLACEAGLIIFAFGGIFLSLEVFELPWIMLVIGGVTPRVLERYFRAHPEALEPPLPRLARLAPLRLPPRPAKPRPGGPAAVTEGWLT